MADDFDSDEDLFDPEKELEHWRKEYQQVAPEDEKSHPSEHSERRSGPRYNFDEGANIFAHIGPKALPIINIAIGGVAFYSDVSFAKGTKLLLSALGMIALDVEVLSCVMEETNSSLMEYRYRVRANFGPRVNGYQVYVLAREMYLKQGGEVPPEGVISEPGTP